MTRRCDLARALCSLAVLAAVAGPTVAWPAVAHAQAASGLKRGDVLPESQRGQIVADYQHWRLRRPPEGYAWYRVGGQFVLASMTTGVIFDVTDAK